MSSNDIEWEVFDEPVSRNVVTKTGNLFGVKFPEDFIIHAQKYHGGWPDKTEFNYKDANGAKKLSGLDELLSFNPEKHNYIVNIFNTLSQSHFPANIIPIGTEASGNYICLDYSKNRSNPVVVLWQHDKNVEDSVSYVADNFTDFLQMLYEADDLDKRNGAPLLWTGLLNF